jgi:pyruvate formate lyase activating enzyme
MAMNLFFDRTISRRGFLKTCGAAALAGSLLPKLLKSAEARELEYQKGFLDPQPARYYGRQSGNKVHCLLCPRGCVVTPGKRGFCRVRENRKGEYFTLAYANPCAIHIDPIEKKPLFHFIPATTALSLALAGCNFTCKNCQNWDISQSRPDDTFNYHIAPGEMVDLALEFKNPTIAYTYTEPSVFFEYVLDTSRAARVKGVRNMIKSNGYLNPEPMRELAPYLDAANIDLKGFRDDFYKDVTGGTLAPVLATIKRLKKEGVWLEITNLVIPEKNDGEDMIKELCVWIMTELGPDVPLHFSRFYPQYKLANLPPTPADTLVRVRDAAKDAGLNYVYIGNVPELDAENTTCPNCGKLLIERQGYDVQQNNLLKGECKFCHKKIPGRWI